MRRQVPRVALCRGLYGTSDCIVPAAANVQVGDVSENRDIGKIGYLGMRGILQTKISCHVGGF